MAQTSDDQPRSGKRSRILGCAGTGVVLGTGAGSRHPRSSEASMSIWRSRRGVTLIELIIIIGCLLILAALLLPIIARILGAAVLPQSQNNLRQIGIACHNFHDSYGKWPPGLGKNNNADGPTH